MGYGKRSEVRNGVEGVVCSRCKEFKPVSEFTMRSPLLRLYQYYCRSCQAAIDKVNNAKQLEERGGRKLVRRIPGSDQSYCARCGKWKPNSEFNLWSKEKGKLQYYCRDCEHAVGKQHFTEHRATVKKANKTSMEKARQKAQGHLQKVLKGAKCADCGTTDPRVLTFHHVKGQKKYDISNMVSNGMSIDSLLGEMEKTIILCFNCHMKREQERTGSYRSLW